MSDSSPKIPPDPEEPIQGPSSEFAEALASFEREAATPRAEGVTGEVVAGARVRGKVVALTGEHALVDIGLRSEASADLAPFRQDDGTLRIAVGDVLDLFVLEAGDQVVLAPSLRPEAGAGLERLRQAQAAGMPVSGRVSAINAGGLRVELGGVRGFCPLSQIESGYCAEPAGYVGRTLEFLVTGVEEGKRGVVLSRRELLRRQERDEARRRLAALKPGDDLEGTVRRLEAFGAFVDLGGMDGMVHVSEIQHGRVAHPREVLREGEKVRVRVLRLETGKDGRPRIALSIKASAPDPWTGIEQRLAPGSRVQGKVVRLVDFGAFVIIEPGVDGLVHVSEISSHRIERVKDALAVGQQVEAIVLAVDPTKKRVSLSIRAALGEPEASAPMPPASAAPAREGELTTMAIALRKAAEKARRRQEHPR
jgi:small subunit ribosomal protein S1